MTSEQQLAAYHQALLDAYYEARGERLAELHGRHTSTFDKRGLHPFSFLFGRAAALRPRDLEEPDEKLRDEEVPLEWLEPYQLRNRAHAEADRMFRDEIRQGGSEDA